jgi:uncharacterized protein DUF6152
MKGGDPMHVPAYRRNKLSRTAKNVIALLLSVLALLTCSGPLSAHHGAASFDNSRTVTIDGTVTDYTWTNPHVYLKVDAKDESGNTQHWVLEAQSVVNQANAGWTKTMFKPGDHVLIDATPAKGGRLVGLFRGRIVINGREFKRIE